MNKLIQQLKELWMLRKNEIMVATTIREMFELGMLTWEKTIFDVDGTLMSTGMKLTRLGKWINKMGAAIRVNTIGDNKERLKIAGFNVVEYKHAQYTNGFVPFASGVGGKEIKEDELLIDDQFIAIGGAYIRYPSKGGVLDIGDKKTSRA